MKPIRWSEDSRLNIVTTEMPMGVDCIVELDWIWIDDQVCWRTGEIEGLGWDKVGRDLVQTERLL